MKWYRLAAEQGIVEAQYNLGQMYRVGLGVAENDVEAAKWFRRAAEQGDADAQYRIGLMYASGQGIAQDKVEAYMWFALSAVQGHKDGKSALKRMDNEMPPEQIKQAQALVQEWLAKHK